MAHPILSLIGAGNSKDSRLEKLSRLGSASGRWPGQRPERALALALPSGAGWERCKGPGHVHTSGAGSSDPGIYIYI